VDFSFAYDNAIDSGGFNFGGAGLLSRKPAIGRRTGMGKMTIEYTDNTLRDAWLAGTSLPLTVTYASTTLISGSSFPTFQLAIPAIKLNGDLPAVTNAATPVQVSVDFEVTDDRVAAHPLYIAIVTAETVI
jgi:hypothetical protein